MRTKIIYEDEQVLVCHKPAGLAAQSAKVGQPDVVSELKKYLVAGNGSKGALCGNGKSRPGAARNADEPYLGIVHRLDQPVEGLIVFAKTKETAAYLSKQLTENTLNKQYYAHVCGKPECATGELVDYLQKDGNVAKVVPAGTPEAKKAVLQYRVAKEPDNQPGTSLLDIHIETGRFHQIRAQLSNAGWPILGDSKYGTEESLQLSRQLNIRNVALFAYKLEFVHPKTGKRMEFKLENKTEERKPY